VGEAVIFLGPPGAGKGTQAVRLGKEEGFTQLSTGNILRDHMARGTVLGQRVKPLYDRGELIPDDLMLPLVREALAEMPNPKVIFDGFPRTLAQAQALGQILQDLDIKLLGVLLVTAPMDELVRRLLERAQKEGRSDDNEETIRNRMNVYQEKTRPLVDHYRKTGSLKEVNGLGSMDGVYASIQVALGVKA
jgi:adenylate kinase